MLDCVYSNTATLLHQELRRLTAHIGARSRHLIYRRPAAGKVDRSFLGRKSSLALSLHPPAAAKYLQPM